jgi:hypothetical protein
VRIERIRGTFDVEVKFTQFPLHPETPPEGMTLEHLFAGRPFDLDAAKARLTALMAEQGLPYPWADALSRSTNRVPSPTQGSR